MLRFEEAVYKGRMFPSSAPVKALQAVCASTSRESKKETKIWECYASLSEIRLDLYSFIYSETWLKHKRLVDVDNDNQAVVENRTI